jgi:transcriptional regulator with XRE-family HTH domain
VADTSNDPLKFPGTLKPLRRQRNWSQKDLAEKLGVSEDTIKHWEGGNALPNFQNRQRLCELFGMGAEELGLVKVEEESFSKTVVAPQSPSGMTEQSQMSELHSREERGGREGDTISIEVKKPKPNRPSPESPTVLGQSRKQIHAFRLQEQNRTQMLRTLRHDYETILKNSLQGAVLIDLDLAEKRGAVSNAANLLLRVTSQNERLLPSGTSIVQVYEEAQQKLLILGAPGVGKSTLLTELALHLITQAEADERDPLPVIVPLSTWAIKHSPLETWLGEQISQIYHIPRKLSDQWVREKQFLPLLDGLDEMNEVDHPVCIVALNTYLRTYQGPIIICSRSAEYETAVSRQRLRLQNAVVVQPLTNKQIDTFLAQAAGESSSELRQALKESSTLQELATRPLMLNLLLLTYGGMSIRRLHTQASELQQQVEHDYVEHMIAQKGDSKRYPLERTCLFLGWLARQMHKHNQTVFYLEHLQPSWLPPGHFRPIYERLTGKGTSVFIGLLISLSINAFFFGAESFANDVLFGLTGGLIGWLIYSERKEKFSVTAMKQALRHRWGSLVSTSVKYGLLVGTLIGLVFAFWPPEGSRGGLIRGLITGGSMFVCFFLLTLIIQAGKFPENVSLSGRSRWAFLSFSPALRREHIELGIFTGLLLGLCIGISAGIGMGVSSVLSYTTIGTLLSLILLGKESSIELKEIVTLSISNLVQRRHLLSTLYIFLLVFLLYGLSVGFQYGLKDALIYGFSGALSTSILYWIFIGLWIGVSQETLNDQDRVELNQGIRYSLRNALLIGLLASGISICVGALSDILNYELRSVLDTGFSVGLHAGFARGLSAIGRDVIFFELFGAFLPFLLTGGLTWLCHYLLRWLLYRAGVVPLRYKHFLDDAMQRILLYQVGGGYIFIHRTILDYFVEQDIEESPSRLPTSSGETDN